MELPESPSANSFFVNLIYMLWSLYPQEIMRFIVQCWNMDYLLHHALSVSPYISNYEKLIRIQACHEISPLLTELLKRKEAPSEVLY